MSEGQSNELPRGRSWARTVLVLILGILPSACTDTATVTAPRARLVPSQVTDAVAAALTPDGRFVLASSVVNPPGQVTEAQARSIATRYVRDVAWTKLGDWTAAHGAAIQPEALTSCDRALYAASPYASLNGVNLSETAVRTFGAHWVVPMCGQAGQLQIVVAFSALATELTANLGSPRPLPWERSDVMSFGIRAGTADSMYSPEGAAVFAFKRSGKRVNSVPELIMSPMPTSPVLVRWRLDLEAPIAVTGTRSAVSRQRATLLIGFGDTFESSGLLDRDPQGGLPQSSWIDSGSGRPFTVVLLPNAPGAVEIVTRGNR